MIIQNTQSATYLQALLYNLSTNNINNANNISENTNIIANQQVSNKQLEEQAYNITLSDNAIAMAQEEQSIPYNDDISQEVNTQTNNIAHQTQYLTNTDLINNLANSLEVSQTINLITQDQQVITGSTPEQSTSLTTNVSNLIDINNAINAYQTAASIQIPTTQNLDISAQTTLSDTAYGIGISIDQAA